MKTKRGLVIWLTALVLVMAGVAPAAARKDNNPGEGPQPVEVEACEEVAGAVVTDGTITIPVAGGGSIQFECLWSPAEPAAETEGPWYGRVGISTDKALGSLVVFVRDDSPGDICLLEQLTQPEGTVFEFEFPLVVGEDQYWENHQTSWCKHFEPSDRVDLNGPPLHLSVGFRSKRGTTVTITLSVVQSDQTGT